MIDAIYVVKRSFEIKRLGEKLEIFVIDCSIGGVAAADTR